jgi:hypothetical protein
MDDQPEGGVGKWCQGYRQWTARVDFRIVQAKFVGETDLEEPSQHLEERDGTSLRQAVNSGFPMQLDYT